MSTYQQERLERAQQAIRNLWPAILPGARTAAYLQVFPDSPIDFEADGDLTEDDLGWITELIDDESTALALFTALCNQ